MNVAFLFENDNTQASKTIRSLLLESRSQVKDLEPDLEQWLPEPYFLGPNDSTNGYQILFRIIPSTELPDDIKEWYLEHFADWRGKTGPKRPRKRLFSLKAEYDSPLRRGFRFLLGRTHLDDPNKKTEILAGGVSVKCASTSTREFNAQGYESFAPLTFVHFYEEEECTLQLDRLRGYWMPALAAGVAKTYSQQMETQTVPKVLARKALVIIHPQLKEESPGNAEFAKALKKLLKLAEPNGTASREDVTFVEDNGAVNTAGYTVKVWLGPADETAAAEKALSEYKVNQLLLVRQDAGRGKVTPLPALKRRGFSCPQNPLVVWDYLWESLYLSLWGSL